MPKKKKRCQEIEIPDKIIRQVLIGLGGLGFISLLTWLTPWSDLKAAAIEEESKSFDTQILSEIKDIKLALVALQQKDTSIKNVHEYLLTKDVIGTNSFLIDENTCAHGARVIVRLRDEVRNNRTPAKGDITIQGISKAKSRTVYSAKVLVDEVISAKMRSLPSSMILDEETVFPEYRIVPSANSKNVEYKVACY